MFQGIAFTAVLVVPAFVLIEPASGLQATQFSSRRQALGKAAKCFLPLTIWTGNAKADDGSQTNTVVYSDSVGSYTASSGWEQVGSGFRDRFTQESCVTEVALYETRTELDSIASLGKVENVQVASSLGLDRALLKADLVAASKIIGADGNLYFKWDLALAPSKCATNDQFGGALGCSYDRIYLLSASVASGKLRVLQVRANADEWKGHSLALKNLRDSFVAKG